LLQSLRGTLAGVLAIGAGTRSWLIDRGADPAIVYPFAYFVEPPTPEAVQRPPALGFCYVGQLIPRKRVDRLIKALATARVDANLEIIGLGPEESALRQLAANLAPGRVTFHPPLAFADVPRRIASADYLVLPSRFDGWGAVVVESLMVGTPVLCSDTCGSSVAVEASGAGHVFRHDDVGDLERSIRTAASEGRIAASRRAEIIAWSRCFSGAAGADYLLEILDVPGAAQEIIPPWQREKPIFSNSGLK
jgi:glycosyltransferase involved in cell wall biosynthesis